MDGRQGDSRSVDVLKVLQRRRFLVLLGVSLGSVGLVACGGDGGGDRSSDESASQLPTPYSFPGNTDKDNIHSSCIPGNPGC